jgi:hypothetical protein
MKQHILEHLHIIVALAAAAVVLTASIWLKIGAETAAAVTAAYAVLVYYQLGEMRTQRKQALDDRESDKRDSRVELQPKQHVLHTSTNNGQLVYIMSCAVMNPGKVMARYAQPVLTAVATDQSDSTWQPIQPWLPIPLYWSSDDVQFATDKPTQERHLLPIRQYFYQLAVVETDQERPLLEFTTLELPHQRPRHPPGRYCVEITIFLENGEPARTWYVLELCDDHWPLFRASGVERADLFQRDVLRVEQLPSRPWS